jgi:hypothetical protein
LVRSQHGLPTDADLMKQERAAKPGNSSTDST